MWHVVSHNSHPCNIPEKRAVGKEIFLFLGKKNVYDALIDVWAVLEIVH